jgi:hypothetical protein
MKKILVIAILTFTLSCAEDPSVQLLESYRAQFQNGQGGRYEAGEEFNGPLKYWVVDQLSQSDDAFRIEFKVTKGGGQVSPSSVFTDDNNVAMTDWQLGNSSFEQVVRASAYKPDGSFITSSDFKVYAFQSGVWNEVTGSADGSITGMVADTVNDLTLMITNGSIYRQGSRYYIWEKISFPETDSPRTMKIDSNGIIYVGTWNGEILRSNDHGATWIKCTKPYADNIYFVSIYVANDNWLWVYKQDYPTKFSKDGGITWLEAGRDLAAQGFGDVFRLKNGILLFHGSNCCSFSISDDNGVNWIRKDTPGHTNKMYVNENDEIFFTSDSRNIYRSINMGVSFELLHSVSPQFGTTMDNVFNKFGDTYYIQIPGYGILKSKDLLTYQDFYINNEISNLFIDHNGVMIAKDWNSNTVWYYKMP